MGLRTSPRTAGEQVVGDWGRGRKEAKKHHGDRVGRLLREMRDGRALGRGSGTGAVCEMGLKSADGEI
jgi:hypothetical protein